MNINYNAIGQSKTPKNYMDFLRPTTMKNATAIFKKLQLINGSEQIDTVIMNSIIANQITSTKGSEIDQIWGKIENSLHNRKTLKTIADSPEDKLNTVLGLIYNAMEVVDKGDNIEYVSNIRNSYLGVKSHIFSRFIDKMTGMNRRNLERTINTIDSFFERVTKRFNNRVKKGEISGYEIPL